MMRQKLLNALLIASFGAVAATAAAQTGAPAQNNTPRNAPVGDTAAPATGSGTYGATAPGAPTPKMDNGVPTDMSGYKRESAGCDQQPVSSRAQCRTTLNTRYSSVAPKCQKLTGSALDDCLKGADTGQ